MTSSNGNIFRVTGHLCGEFTGPLWIPRSGEFPTQRPVTRSFDVFFICVWINGWVNNRKAGDVRRYRAHYGDIVMWQHQAITQTNVVFSLSKLYGIHLLAISRWVHKLLFCIMSLKIMHIKYRTWSILVLRMACFFYGAKPLQTPILTNQLWGIRLRAVSEGTLYP